MTDGPKLLNNKKPEMDKWYALFILVFVLVMIYFLAFQGFTSDHAIMNEQLADLQQNREENTRLQAMIPELQKRINTVKETVGDNTNFLASDTDNLGKAELTRILKNIVAQNTQVESECQTINHTPSKDREPDQFEKVILKVRMRCQFDKMIKVLADIETHVPHLFVDNLQLDQRAIRRSRRNVKPTKPMLEVRFDLYAYLNKPIRVKEKRDERGRRK
jgi:general secretion pathway protein M